MVNGALGGRAPLYCCRSARPARRSTPRLNAMRLVKFLAHAGVASRRAAEVLIAAGRVSVGGEVVTNPATDVDGESAVAVDGRPVQAEPREVHALNKPAGVVSTAHDT